MMQKRMHFSSVLVSLLLTLCLPGFGRSQSQQPFSSREQHSVNSHVDSIMRCNDTKHVSVSFQSISNGFTKDYHALNETPKKHFCIGGVTQAFTGVLLAKLIDENRNDNVTLDTPIKDIIGSSVALPRSYIWEHLNLKDILGMRSGLVGMDIIPIAEPFNVSTLIKNIRYLPKIASFREKAVHNEVLFALIEEVALALGNDTWANLLTRHILKPLGMTETLVIGSSKTMISGSVKHNRKSYILTDSVYSGLELVAPAASICTTSADMSRWLRFLVQSGRIDNNQVVRKEVLDMTYRDIQPKNVEGPIPITGNAFGWTSGIYKGLFVSLQDGSLPGFQTLSIIIPSRSLAVYVSLTGEPSAENSAVKFLINNMVLELLLKQKDSSLSENDCAVLNKLANDYQKKQDDFKDVHRESRPKDNVEKYEGSYRNYAYGVVTIMTNASKDNTLLLLNYGKITYQLEPTNVNDTFQLFAREGNHWYSTSADWYKDNNRLFAVFSRDAEEGVKSVKVHGFDRSYDPIFSKNLPPPPDFRHTDSDDNTRCVSSKLMTSLWSILLISALILLR